MENSVLAAVRESAERLGAAVPLWLKEGRSPDFETRELGAEGPVMVLLHGLFGAVSNWDAAFPLFSEFTKTIALSFPILTGHRSEVRVPGLVAYTEYFIRQRELAPVVLCGNSLGGHVALRLCLAAPKLVDCLVLAGASGLYEHTVDALPVRPTPKFIEEHMRRVFFNERFITPAAVASVMEVISSRANHLNLIHAARSAKKDNLLKLLRQIEVPTLLLWGEDDEVTTMDVAEQFHRNIPNSRLVTKKDCGHAPMIEYPEWFAAEVKGFLREHSRLYSGNF